MKDFFIGIIVAFGVTMLCFILFEDLKLEKEVQAVKASLNFIPTFDTNEENKNKLDDMQRQLNSIDSKIDRNQESISNSLEEIFTAMAKETILDNMGDDVSSIKLKVNAL